MPKLSFYLDYFKRTANELQKLSQQENIFLPYLWFDFISASVVHGAILNHYTRGKLYSLKGCERKKSLTYRRILKAYDKCNAPEAIPYLNNKHLFNAHFSKYVQRRWLYSADMTFEEFRNLCAHSRSIIVKPEDGVEGHGVRKYTPPSELRDLQRLFDECKSFPCMVEECIEQHPEMVFQNTSVNTIRAHSIIDPSGEIHILKMLLRAGVGNTVVDNYASGGCVYEIDPQTGYIVSPSLKKNGEVVYIHPSTDIVMLGRKIPLWDEVVKSVKDAHQLLPKCRFIGWDVAITPNGVELIEGNHNPDYELFEFFGSKGWWNNIKTLL